LAYPRFGREAYNCRGRFYGVSFWGVSFWGVSFWILCQSFDRLRRESGDRFGKSRGIGGGAFGRRMCKQKTPGRRSLVTPQTRDFVNVTPGAPQEFVNKIGAESKRIFCWVLEKRSFLAEWRTSRISRIYLARPWAGTKNEPVLFQRRGRGGLAEDTEKSALGRRIIIRRFRRWAQMGCRLAGSGGLVVSFWMCVMRSECDQNTI
jgi:hypothetical protein